MQLPQVVGGRNVEHPALSNKIRIETDPVMGRYGTAGSPIRVGDVLAVDVPFASVMNPLKFPTNCHHCYRPWVRFFLSCHSSPPYSPVTQRSVLPNDLSIIVASLRHVSDSDRGIRPIGSSAFLRCTSSLDSSAVDPPYHTSSRSSWRNASH